MGQVRPAHKAPQHDAPSSFHPLRDLAARCLAGQAVRPALGAAGASAVPAGVAHPQNSLLDLLVKVMLNISRLPKPWVRAVLERTRLGDPRFIAHLSSSIQMSALALKTGVPIPALTTPVVEELYSRSARYGFEVTLKQEPDLPAHVDAEVLRSEVYMHFSVGALALRMRSQSRSHACRCSRWPTASTYAASVDVRR